jgi:hypothetical protein
VDFGVTDLRTARRNPNGRVHRTQTNFPTQPIRLRRSSAARFMERPRTYKTGYFQCLLKPKFEASADLVIQEE